MGNTFWLNGFSIGSSQQVSWSKYPMLEDVGRSRFGFGLRREMHPLAAPVLLGMPKCDAFDLDAEPQPRVLSVSGQPGQDRQYDRA